MKQKITKTQLRELSKKGKEKYWKKFWSKHKGREINNFQDAKTGRFYYPNSDIKTIPLEFYPLLSIGKMIEFLGDKWLYGTSVGIEGEDYGQILPPENKKLCYELWQATKEKLEK